MLTRLIPARAGNTERIPSTNTGPSAHPRSRGEHASEPKFDRHCCGSSPLARGTLQFSKLIHAAERLIPARAGNTTLGGYEDPRGAAHPRSRGEHLKKRQGLAKQDGSSPLARGTRGKLR